MHHSLVAMLLASVVLLSSNAALAQDRAESAPPSGIGAMVVGYGALGVGAVNLATLPVCSAEFYPNEAEDVCMGLSLVMGIGGIALGVPLVIFGHHRRARYKEWRASRLADVSERLQLSLVPGGGSAGYRWSF